MSAAWRNLRGVVRMRAGEASELLKPQPILAEGVRRGNEYEKAKSGDNGRDRKDHSKRSQAQFELVRTLQWM